MAEVCSLKVFSASSLGKVGKLGIKASGLLNRGGAGIGDKHGGGPLSCFRLIDIVRLAVSEGKTHSCDTVNGSIRSRTRAGPKATGDGRAMGWARSGGCNPTLSPSHACSRHLAVRSEGGRKIAGRAANWMGPMRGRRGKIACAITWGSGTHEGQCWPREGPFLHGLDRYVRGSAVEKPHSEYADGCATPCPFGWLRKCNKDEQAATDHSAPPAFPSALLYGLIARP